MFTQIREQEMSNMYSRKSTDTTHYRSDKLHD